jgi:hypothetical protein
MNKPNKTKNQVNVLYPYRTKYGVWCFDDKELEIVAEPFVGSINTMIDHFAQGREEVITYISHSPIPEASGHLIKTEEGNGWYELEGMNIKGWLCPCMLNYFEGYVDDIYFKIEIPKN